MIFLFFYFALTAWLLKLKGASLFRFDMFATLSWLFSTFIGSMGLVIQPLALSWELIIFVVVCHSVMIVAFWVTHSKVQYFPGNNDTLSDIRINIIIIPVVIFILFYSGSIFINGEIPIISSIGKIEIARVDHRLLEKTFISQLLQILIYFTVPYCIVFITLKKNVKFVFLFLFSVISITDHSLREGGRALIIFTAISIISSIFTLTKSKLSTKAVYGFIGIFSMYILASQFYLARNSNFGDNVDFYIKYNCNGAILSEPIRAAPISVQALTLSSCYFSAPLSIFERMSKDYELRYSGAYNLGIISPEKFVIARADIEDYFASRNLAQNPWATSIRDIWLDVGYAAPIVFILIGLMAGKIGNLTPNGPITDLARFGLITTLAFMIPFQSPFILRYIVYSIISTYIVDALTWLIQPFFRTKMRIKNVRG